MADEFFTLQEVADKFRVVPATIRAMIQRGEITALRIGLGKAARIRIPRSELERLQIEAVTPAPATTPVTTG